MASISKLPSGSWRVLIRVKGHKAISSTFSTEKLAKAFAKDKERQLEEIKATGRTAAPKGSTVGHYIDAYLDYIQPGRTLQRSALFVYKSLKERFGKIGIERLSKSHMDAFIEDRKKNGAQGQTIACDLSLLSSVLRFCYDVKHLDVDPDLADKARKSLKSSHKLRIKSREVECVPTLSEIDKIIGVFANKKRQVIDMPNLIRFALYTSMRQSEICRIRIEDLDRENKTVIIRDRKHPEEKMGNDETVPLLPPAWEIVEKCIEGRTSGFIFPYNPKSVCVSFTRARTQANVARPVRFHDLRHKAITDFFGIGLNVPQVALMSGHRDWQTLKRYTHVKSSDVHAAYNSLNIKQQDAKNLSEQVAWLVQQMGELRGGQD
ncbi:tyrosine-type recombinase/integrase [Pseudomonas asiatica]|uniref:Tyrosine-type recombinase/integrase n=1 Tax=Pseudomonas asiatica TaxID=2219225 RepID=A0AAJ5IBF3_9PSED|nr:site-specific integrase [Pseudomonas asiatica]UUC20513.1 tyrosine-type recombinase/integrase [Pseudomonas asiatica]